MKEADSLNQLYVQTNLDLAEAQGRDSPIVKHYSSIKNSCFVNCVNSAVCSES
jgi:hypothetical protein